MENYAQKSIKLKNIQVHDHRNIMRLKNSIKLKLKETRHDGRHHIIEKSVIQSWHPQLPPSFRFQPARHGRSKIKMRSRYGYGEVQCDVEMQRRSL